MATNYKEKLNLNLCITDIINSGKMHKGKDGKDYIDVTASENEKPDNWGFTHMVYIPEKTFQQGVYPQRVGKGKVYDPQNPPKKQENTTQQQKQTPPQTEEEAEERINNNLPF